MALFIFVIILIALILVHEFGHFVMAKLSGMRVEEFGIGFPPRLFGIQKGDTLYSFNLLLFGGFVRIFGESTETDVQPGGRRFTDKPWYLQGTVVIAGILCNLLFAWILLSAGYMVGIPAAANSGVGTIAHPHTTIVSVVPGSPADKVGLMSGDQITAVETGATALSSGADALHVQQFIANHQTQSIVLSVERHGMQKTFLVTPAPGIVLGERVIGVELADVGIVQLPFFQALKQGAVLFWHMTVSTAQGLVVFFAALFKGTANFSQIAGPIGIADIGASAVQQGASATLVLTALISINLALINILPIPGLDGGRLTLLLIERARGRAISERLMTRLTLLGFALLIALLIAVSYHDILHLLHP